VSLSRFSQVTIDNVISGIRRLPHKQSAVDPIPTTVLKQVGDVLAAGAFYR